MRKAWRQGFGLVILTSILFTYNLQVYANSAQSWWRGTSMSGAIVWEEECPIVVEKEVLTLDVEEFPENRYTSVEEFLAYSGKVSAEYTFYNPTDYNVTATLVFPFGNEPMYSEIYTSDTYEHMAVSDVGKYDILVDGVVIEKKLRHTFSSYGEEFVLEKDMARLHDGYLEDEFYSRDLPVTLYVYQANGIQDASAATAAFVVKNDMPETKLILKEQCGWSGEEGQSQLEVWAENEEEYHLYVLGEPMEELPAWKIYSDGSTTKEIAGQMELVHSEEMTYEEFIMLDYEEESNILAYDWYNAKTSYIQMNEYNGNTIAEYGFVEDFRQQMMRWYEYEIQIGAGERIVNTVTAPLYPDIDAGYEPPVYSYTYLLSPAQTWTEFGTLEIILNTPYHMVDSEMADFEKTESGYRLLQDTLPEGELKFSLSEEERPITSRMEQALGLGSLFVVVSLAAAVIAVTIIFIRKRKH